MRKTIKRTLWGIGVVIALMVVIIVWYGIKTSSEIKKLTPIGTGHLANDTVYSIKDSFVNVFIIKNGNNYILIDAGNSIEGIKDGIERLKITPDSVVAILLTHSDGDHINAISLFPKAKVYMSRQEEQMINGKTPRFLLFNNRIFNTPYSVLEDNQVVELLGLKIQCILVPGHTPGSMCYLVNDKYLFTGDALSLKNDKIDRFNKFFNMDSETAAKSIYKLTNLPNAKFIFTSHNGISCNYKNAVSDWK